MFQVSGTELVHTNLSPLLLLLLLLLGKFNVILRLQTMASEDTKQYNFSPVELCY